jgi:hypothetical protein
MSISESMFGLIGINPRKFLSSIEILILEAELITRIHDELREFFREKYKDYFQLMKFSIKMENRMLNKNLISNLVKDILISQQYTSEGIAYYANTFEEVINDIASGINIDPSFPLGHRIIELHRTVRPNLYRELMRKIANEYLIQK